MRARHGCGSAQEEHFIALRSWRLVEIGETTIGTGHLDLAEIVQIVAVSVSDLDLDAQTLG